MDVARSALERRILSAVNGPAPPRAASGATPPSFPAVRAAGGERAAILLDEALELRTFESFPGLRHVMQELLAGLAAAGNRFVLSTRYLRRAGRALAQQPDGFLVIHVSPMG